MRHKFFTVSLAKNIPVLKRSIPLINRFYGQPDFSIICPENTIELFNFEFKAFKNVKIISETSLINFDYFCVRAKAYLAQITGNEYLGTRLGWYYQQVLKISFLAEQAENNLPIVMWDADTIMLSKIAFFRNNHSVLYGSMLEFHRPYFQTMARIFEALPTVFSAFTVQFFTSTKDERVFLLRKLEQYMLRNESMRQPEWIAEIIIKSVVDTHASFEGSLFSEQELVGLSNILCIKREQRPLAYLRWEFEGILSAAQIVWVTLLGFKHVTYENVDALIDKKQRWVRLLIFTAKEFYRQKLKIHTAQQSNKFLN